MRVTQSLLSGNTSRWQYISDCRGNISLRLAGTVFLIGMISLLVAVSENGLQAHLRLFTVSFLFLLGITQAGVVFCAITRLVGAQWAKPYYRLAELSTMAFFPFAMLGFLLIFFTAKERLFYWWSSTSATSADQHLNPWLNANWLLIRNLFALLVFYALSAIYFAKGLKPDLLPGEDSAIEHNKVARQLYILSPLILISFVLCNTFVAWDFGMMLLPHWHSSIFPIFYWFGNLFAGTSALILFPLLLGHNKTSKLQIMKTDEYTVESTESSLFGPTQIRCLGMLVTAFTLMWLYFYWSQYFVIWFGNLPRETDLVWRQMYGHYSPYYWSMMAGCFFIPFVALIFAAVKRSLLMMCLLALGINLGIWISKYLIVIPVFSPDDTPFSHWLDVSLSLGLLAGFVLLMVLLARRLPIYAYWEINLKSK